MRRSRNLYPAKVRTVKGDKHGYINDSGDFVIRPIFEEANDFKEDLAVVKQDERYGVINTKGKYIVLPQYQSITEFKEGRSQVVDKEGYRVINDLGQVLTKKAYSYIGTYKEKRAIYANTSEEGKYLYGFLDWNGDEIIPLQYEMVHDFRKGKAVVKIKENEFAFISPKGEVIKKFQYPYVGDLREGLLPFQQERSGPYGYINEQGNVVIQPQFDHAQYFQGQRAIITKNQNEKIGYGLIDRKGNIIIKPQYNDILLLGSNRVAVGVEKVHDKPYFLSVYAIATTDGQFLTDFKYYGLFQYEEGYTSVYDSTHTFFLDLDGRVARHFPILEGSGSLSFVGNLIRALVDQRLSYYDLKGNLVWKQNTIITLSEQYEIHEEKFKPNRDYLVYYPKVKGIGDALIEEEVNQHIQELSSLKDIPANIQLDYGYTGDFSVQFFKKNLLVLELTGYRYPYGAAHGMPFKTYPHINLVNGRFYSLADLFKANSDYQTIISNLIEEQIKSGSTPYSGYIFPDAYKGIREDQPFYISENALYIYFEPYEIAAYAAGFPTFKIPFNEIMMIIDTNSEFWKSFS